MSAQHASVDYQQLNQTVASLAEALALSERRHAHLAHIVRWGVAGIVMVIAMTGFVITDTIGIAHADKKQGFPQGTTVVEALNNINANLTLFGMAGETLQQAVPAVQKAMMGNTDVQRHVENYLKGQNIEVTPENMQRYATAAIVESMVTTMVDTVVLMQRIREDSNAFRDTVGGPVPALHAIEKELQLMNIAMRSVPAMAVQMDLMNRNMASMTHSMGSTMGRMGSWMPW